MNFPISYLLLYLGFAPEVTVIVAIIISQICLLARLLFLRTMVKLPVKQFVTDVYFKVILVTILSALLPLVCYVLIQPSITRFIIIGLTSVMTSATCIYYVGCNHNEQKKVINAIVKIKKKLLH